MKRVVFDPTTYVPAILGYHATYRDWQTSQPFFRNGYNERNPRFTTSGLPNDRPISHSDGNRKILVDALINFQTSAVNNLTQNVIEHVLIERYPEHRKLWRTLGWVERVGFASFTSYRWSADHYRQTTQNEMLEHQQRRTDSDNPGRQDVLRREG